MKTRAQIYEREAAVLLRDISMYQVMTEGQLLRLHPGKEDKTRNLLAAVWVLADFIDQVEYHSVGDYPAKIIFFADGEVYEIIHAAQGKEVLLSHVLADPGEQPSRYLVLVDEPAQISELLIPNVNGYCTVSQAGEVQYYQKEGA